MQTDDEIGAMIRVHYELDRALRFVVEAMVPSSKCLKLNYTSQRINLLIALGMPEIRLKPTKIVNAIRNDFAHREKEAFVDDDVSSLHHAIERVYARPIPATFRLDFHSKIEGESRSWIYGDMNLKEKFCFLGSLTLASIATIPNQFEALKIHSKLTL